MSPEVEFWLQYGALGVLGGMGWLLFWKERARAQRAEERLLTKAESYAGKIHDLTVTLSETVQVVERVAQARREP